MELLLSSQVIISSNAEKTIEKLEALKQKEQIIKIVKEDSFLVDDAKLAIEKAYLTSDERTIIILAAKVFSPIVQNKLLKVIEEPPPKKEFIIITPSKATILGTIRSRLPIVVLDKEESGDVLELDMKTLSLASMYAFTQTHKFTDAQKMKVIVQQICKEAIDSLGYNLDEKTLVLFSDTLKALDMGSPPQFILNTLLLKLLARKKIKTKG